MHDISFRRVVSLTSLSSFCLLIFTGVVLYIVPQGRVAYWADWRLWALTKEEWTHIHINLALLFLMASGFHIYYNWKPVLTYLKSKSKRLVILTREFTIALVLCMAFCLLTYFSVPPLKTVIDINSKIKDRHERVYGSPPYGHAELSSLELFCGKTGLDLERSIRILVENNIKLSGEKQTIKDIARSNGMSPQQVYSLINVAKKSELGKTSEAPEEGVAPAGLGKKTLAQAAREYNLELEASLAKLASKNIRAKAEMTFKEVAETSGLTPMELFEMMK